MFGVFLDKHIAFLLFSHNQTQEPTKINSQKYEFCYGNNYNVIYVNPRELVFPDERDQSSLMKEPAPSCG